jgi:hypothetical protein
MRGWGVGGWGFGVGGWGVGGWGFGVGGWGFGVGGWGRLGGVGDGEEGERDTQEGDNTGGGYRHAHVRMGADLHHFAAKIFVELASPQLPNPDAVEGGKLLVCARHAAPALVHKPVHKPVTRD